MRRLPRKGFLEDGGADPAVGKPAKGPGPLSKVCKKPTNLYL